MHSLFVHLDNVSQFKQKYPVKLAVIARPDKFMALTNPVQLIVETRRGVHTRCYLAEHKGIRFVIVYGRHGIRKTTSLDIDFELTQEALSLIGIECIIGTFVVGSVKEEDMAGILYIPNDLIGFGGFNSSLRKESGFHNIDMFRPICSGVYRILEECVKSLPLASVSGVTYACFHGYPRLETRAELLRYRNLGCDIVGQTMDPEVTLSREAGCHYGAIAVSIDDKNIRDRFLSNDMTAVDDIRKNMKEGRERSFQVFLSAISGLANIGSSDCNCKGQEKLLSQGSKSEFFYCRPSYLFDEI